jgi:hypothetical protein
MLLIGLGAGIAIAPYLGSGAVWAAGVGIVLGLGLLLVGTPEPPTLGAGQPDQPDMGDRRTGKKPAAVHLAGLGTTVEQILRLAEEQAMDHREEARRKAEQLLSEARAEADSILARARTEAGGQFN